MASNLPQLHVARYGWVFLLVTSSQSEALNLEFKKCLCSRDLDIDKNRQTKTEAFELWIWKIMMKISWMDKISNERVLAQVSETRTMLILWVRKHRWIRHVLWHTNYFVTLMEGRMVGKTTRGRRRLQMYENNGYEVLKRRAEDRSAWRKSRRKKVPKPAVQRTTKEEEVVIVVVVVVSDKAELMFSVLELLSFYSPAAAAAAAATTTTTTTTTCTTTMFCCCLNILFTMAATD